MKNGNAKILVGDCLNGLIDVGKILQKTPAVSFEELLLHVS